MIISTFLWFMHLVLLAVKRIFVFQELEGSLLMFGETSKLEKGSD